MSYQVWDNQLKQYAFQGAIFPSKEDAIEQLISYFSADNTEAYLIEITKVLRETGEFAELEIQEVKT